MAKRKIINFRAFLIIALCVTAIILCVYAYMFNSAAGLTLGVTAIAALAAVCAVFIVRFIKTRLHLAVMLTFIVVVVLCVSAFTVGVISADNWRAGAIYDGYCLVYGRVCDIDTQQGTYRINLDELTINGDRADGILQMSIAADDHNIADLTECGDRLKLVARLNSVMLVSGGRVNGSAYRSDIRYTAVGRSDEMLLEVGEPRALERFTSALRRLLCGNMGEKYGSMAFSILTGDKHNLSMGVFDYFSAAGLAHIMAVSGLHIGFLVLVLNLILCKVGKRVRYPIIAMFLLAYAVLADFSPSVVRAVIMTYISGLGILIGGRRDLLSSLMCAYSVILAVKPFYLFEAGFLLSFGALFGIAVLSNSIARGCEKRGVKPKLGSMIGGSVSASLGIIPAEAYFFNTLHLIAFLINLIVIPYVSVVFIATLILLPIAAIPGCGAVLAVGKYLLMPLDYAAQGLAALPYTVISAESVRWTVFLCLPIVFFASEYVMLPKKTKTAVGWYSAAVCLAIIVISAL